MPAQIIRFGVADIEYFFFKNSLYCYLKKFFLILCFLGCRLQNKNRFCGGRYRKSDFPFFSDFLYKNDNGVPVWNRKGFLKGG